MKGSLAFTALLTMCWSSIFGLSHVQKAMSQPKSGYNINNQNRRLENLWPNGSISDNFFECNGKWEPLGDDINGSLENSYSGSAVAISGEGLIIAVRSLLGGGEDAKQVAPVHVLKYNKMKTAWEKLGDEIPGRWKSGLSKESVSLSDDGMTVALGGITVDTENNVRIGYTKVFTYNSVSRSWEQLGNEIEGIGAPDKRGRAVALSQNGRTILIGEAGFKSGEVMVFKYNIKSSQWKRIGKKIDFIVTEGDYTDVSVSISDDASTVAIGNENKSIEGSKSGSVKVFRYNSSEGNWSRLGNAINGQNPNQRFGSSVSLSGDAKFIAVGSDGTRKDTGSTRIYNLVNSSEWKMIGNPIRGSSVEEYSGGSVSISPDGSLVAIGAPGVATERGDFVGATRVYAYKMSKGAYVQVGDDILGQRRGDHSGVSLELSKDGRRLVIGAPFNNGKSGKSEAGLTRVYQWNSPCAPTDTPTYSPTFFPTSSSPTKEPTADPTKEPTTDPSREPSVDPSRKPSADPSKTPSANPTKEPSYLPTEEPSQSPTLSPSIHPTNAPSANPTKEPSHLPTNEPSQSQNPTISPSIHPTNTPSADPSRSPSHLPTNEPSQSQIPTISPSIDPTKKVTVTPSSTPSTRIPTISPTSQHDPTQDPSVITTSQLPSSKNNNNSTASPIPPTSIPTTTMTLSMEPSASTTIPITTHIPK